MAVPSSGQLKLYADIQTEAGGAQSNTSLHNLSVYAGFSTPDAMSDFYGWADIELPSVTTNGISSVGSSSMTLNGNLTSTGNDTSVQVGFYFGTSTNRTSNTKVQQGTRSTTGTYALGRSGLGYGTTYYSWAYAISDAGEVQGARTQATTTFPPFTPTLGVMQCIGSCLYASDSNPASNFKFERGYFNPYSGVATSTFSDTNCCQNRCIIQQNSGATQVTLNAKAYTCHYFSAAAAPVDVSAYLTDMNSKVITGNPNNVCAYFQVGTQTTQFGGDPACVSRAAAQYDDDNACIEMWYTNTPIPNVGYRYEFCSITQ